MGCLASKTPDAVPPQHKNVGPAPGGGGGVKKPVPVAPPAAVGVNPAQVGPGVAPPKDPRACIREGCSQQSFNGNPGEFCSKYCRDNPLQACICVRPQCGKPTWNGKPGEHCSKGCRQLPPPNACICDRPQCGKPTWNGKPGGYCSKFCMGLPAGPPPWAQPVQPVAVQPAGPNACICVRPQCGKPTWDGKHGFCSVACKEELGKLCSGGCGRPFAAGFPTCCRTCGTSQGRQHGPACKAGCQRVGCSQPSWNGKAGEHCSVRCKEQDQPRPAQAREVKRQGQCWKVGCLNQSWDGGDRSYCCTQHQFAPVACRNPRCGMTGCQHELGYCSNECSDEVRGSQMPPMCKLSSCQNPTFNGLPGFCSMQCMTNRQTQDRANRKGENLAVCRAGCGKATWNGKRDGEWCSVKCREAVEMRPPVLETSNYDLHYKDAKPCSKTDEVWQEIEAVMGCMYRRERRTQDDACQFVKKLQKALDEAKVSQQFCNIADKDSPTLVSVFCWTSCEKDCDDREFCSYLQEAVRLDLNECMYAVTRFWRTLNAYVVTKRERAKFGINNIVQWPQDWMLYRGSRLPQNHLQWFKDAAAAGTIYRTKVATATTKSKIKASDFMRSFSHPKEDSFLMWKFKIDSAEKCNHVNCVESMTQTPDEQEFLFPPYSAFKITKVEKFGDHWVIEADVMPDNRTQAIGGSIPDNAPLAPWS